MVMSEMKILLAEMTWPEVEERLKESDVAIIPVGSTEQHGRHCPFKTDTFIAFNIAKMAAEAAFDDVKPIVLPPISFGVSREHMDFPGSITVMPETLKNLVKDICRSLVHHGFRRIVIVNGHGGFGHLPMLQLAIVDMKVETGEYFALVNYFDLVSDIINEVSESEPQFHADEVETSLVMALGYNVDLSRETAHILQFPSKFTSYGLRIALPSIKDRGYTSGTMGDPRKASKDKGEKILKVAVERLADFLREVKETKL